MSQLGENLAPKANQTEVLPKEAALRRLETGTQILKEHSTATRKTSAETPAKTLAGPPETSEEKAGELHASYLKKVNKFDGKETKATREKLFTSKLIDIRYNQRLLSPPKANETAEESRLSAKEETIKRIRALTSENSNEWYTIDYQKIYELTLGLGDILIDPDIQNVLIEKDGTLILAHRGVVASGKFKGRIGFLDKNNNYVATYTGDKFRILKNTEKPAEEYKKALDLEQSTRDQHRQVFEVSSKQLENYSAPYVSPEEITRNFGKVELNTQLIAEAEKSSQRGTRVREFTHLEERNRPLAQVIRGVCMALGCREALIYATYAHESGFSNNAFGDKDRPGGSKGIGQFRPATWADISRDPEYKAFVNQYYPGQTFDRGENILSDITASVVLLKRIAQKGKIDLTKPLTTADIIYLRGGYNGGNGEPYRKSFLRGETSRYMPFVYNYRNFEQGYMELFNTPQNTAMENSPEVNAPGKLLSKTDKQWKPIEDPKADFSRLIDVKNGQQQWILGCSTTNGVWTRNKNNKENTGFIGLKGSTAATMLQDLPKYCEEIEKAGVKYPPKVIVAEFALNGLYNRHTSAQKHGQALTPEMNAQAEFADHLKIATYLKNKGVKVIKFTTTHHWEEKDPDKNVRPDILAFNRILQARHPELVVDLASVAKSTELHNSTDYDRIAALYEKEANSPA